MRRSKALVLEDTLFGYSITAIILKDIKDLSIGGYNDIMNYIILSFIIIAFLTYVEPIDYLIYAILKWQDKKMLDKPNSQFILRAAFESSYLDYTRVRLKSAIYLMILLIFMVRYGIVIGIIAIIMAIFIFLRFILKDIKDLPVKVYAIAGYIASISVRNIGKR